ncbi:MAG: TRAP transporter small permease [Bacteroidota bacterium]
MKAIVDKYLGYLLVVLMVIMTLDVLWGVVTRYIFGSQAGWTGELARFLLIWISLLGAAYVSGQNQHLAIDLLSHQLNPQQRNRLIGIINGLAILFALLVLVIGGIRLVYITQILAQRSPALGLPMAFVYTVLPVSGLLIIFYKMRAWKS